MNALPIAPAMMAPPATPAQGSGTTDSSFQQELDGQTAVLSAAAEPKAGDDGKAPTFPDATPAADEAAGNTNPDDETGTQTLTDDITMALLLASQVAPIPLSLPQALEMTGQAEGSISADNGSVSQGGTAGQTALQGSTTGQAALQVLDNLLGRAETQVSTNATLQGQNPEQATVTAALTSALVVEDSATPGQTTSTVPSSNANSGAATATTVSEQTKPTVFQGGTAGQAVIQVLDNLLGRTETQVSTTATLQGQNPEQATVTTALTSALVVEDSATPGQTTSTVPSSNPDSGAATATTVSEQTKPTATSAPITSQVSDVVQNSVESKSSVTTIAGKTVEILAMTQATLQASAPSLAPETEAQATTTTVSLRQDGLAQSLQTQLTASLTQQETEDAGAQTGNDDKQQSQSEAMLAAAEKAMPATEEGTTSDDVSIFRSILEAGLKSDAVSVPQSAMKPSTGFTVSEDHLLQQVLDRFALNRQIESGSISLRLHPAELGELKLDVLVQRSTVQLQVTAQNPQVQEMLEQNMSRLREALAQHGFSLDRMEVTLGGNSQEELLRQDSDNGSRYPTTFSSSTAVSDWNLHTDEAAETGAFLTENTTSAGLNIHI